LHSSPDIIKGDKIADNEMGGTCSRHMPGGDEKRTQNISRKTGIGQLEDLGVNGRIILNLLKNRM
jgi:hypothetical protein